VSQATYLLALHHKGLKQSTAKKFWGTLGYARDVGWLPVHLNPLAKRLIPTFPVTAKQVDLVLFLPSFLLRLAALSPRPVWVAEIFFFYFSALRPSTSDELNNIDVVGSKQPTQQQLYHIAARRWKTAPQGTFHRIPAKAVACLLFFTGQWSVNRPLLPIPTKKVLKHLKNLMGPLPVGLGLYGLRRSSASFLSHLGYSPKQVAAHLGHRTLTSLKHYVYILPRAAEVALLKKFSNFFDPYENDFPLTPLTLNSHPPSGYHSTESSD
jgi:hypothetical protein